MSDRLGQARWWSVRRAQSFKPVSYTCPLCGLQLHAMSGHILLVPEGDVSRRRHAHSLCVRKARAEGLLPLRDEWEAAQRSSARFGLGRLFGRRRRGAAAADSAGTGGGAAAGDAPPGDAGRATG